ncbi:MAG: GPP34 family phosphoprotein [Labilithrix sp.]|nr:GPP34 family phosphoprotein [Labilithrix sp.]MCW5813734.1 GPP34 family phosphoprotein [Labilithrix sp.]
MLIAEELLLLLLDDESGSVSAHRDVGRAYVRPVLGGALLAELALGGNIQIGEAGLLRSGKVTLTNAPYPADPLLVDAAATIAEAPRSAGELVNRLGKDAFEMLARRLVDRGILERREDKVLWFFPRTRWPALDSSYERELRLRLAASFDDGAVVEPRIGTLIALLHAIGKAHHLAPMEPGEASRRAKRIAEGNWAAKAVRDTIDALISALIADVALMAANTANH